jgi:glycerol-3-phosphate acyltransferase PlsX
LNPRKVHIAVDVMGGDYGPSVTVPAVIKSLSDNPLLTVTLLGNLDLFKNNYAPSLNAFGDRVRYTNCVDEVGMNEKPSHALRHQQQSSMFQAVRMISHHEADACISAGNTGALMAIAKFVIKTFPGIDRPTVCAEMPTEAGRCLMLDLGANVDCRSEHFLQFALMGSEMAKVLFSTEHPTVALLNIGEEESKGNEQVRLAAALLEENKHINYIGFVEGNDIYQGKANVIVCDGFVGNAVLKASEGVARLISHKIHKRIHKNGASKFFGLFTKNWFLSLFNEINPSRYNGASFLGLQGTVVVSHGNSDIAGFINAIQLACRQVEQQLPQKIQQQINESAHHE